MRLGFYGHSIASWAGANEHTTSFIKVVVDHFKADLVNLGVPQGSEERILHDLKKTKNLDVAVIFHALPKYLYLPKCKRDIAIDKVPEDRLQGLWSENGSASDSLTYEQFENEFMSYGRIQEVFGTPGNFVKCMTAYKAYLHDTDLHLNRYQGAMQLIDLYCAAKVPKVIHVALAKTIPPWMTFTSGVLMPSMAELMLQAYEVGVNPNNLSRLGNKMMAFSIIREIERRSWQSGLAPA